MTIFIFYSCHSWWRQCQEFFPMPKFFRSVTLPCWQAERLLPKPSPATHVLWTKQHQCNCNRLGDFDVIHFVSLLRRKHLITGFSFITVFYAVISFVIIRWFQWSKSPCIVAVICYMLLNILMNLFWPAPVYVWTEITLHTQSRVCLTSFTSLWDFKKMAILSLTHTHTIIDHFSVFSLF